MLKHFSLLPFIAGLIAGLFFVFVYKSEPTFIMKYPHPQNVDGRVYRDKNGVCYKYNSAEVNCDKNEATLKPYPLA
jgi:hypothetical protein